MFERNASGVYESSLLGGFGWLEHGFGSRLSDGWPGEYARVQQVHSAIVHVSEGGPCGEPGDALVSGTPGHWIGIRTADCVPILLADTQNRAVAAVHAGWRGTVTDISGEAVRQMTLRYGTRPEDVVAAIGPAIGRCCFEVGPEVGVQFTSLFANGTNLSHIDLVEANRKLLIRAGLRELAVDAASLCTKCENEWFYSWRRDKEASGRMVAAIRVKEA